MIGGIFYARVFFKWRGDAGHFFERCRTFNRQFNRFFFRKYKTTKIVIIVGFCLCALLIPVVVFFMVSLSVARDESNVWTRESFTLWCLDTFGVLVKNAWIDFKSFVPFRKHDWSDYFPYKTFDNFIVTFNCKFCFFFYLILNNLTRSRSW